MLNPALPPPPWKIGPRLVIYIYKALFCVCDVSAIFEINLQGDLGEQRSPQMLGMRGQKALKFLVLFISIGTYIDLQVIITCFSCFNCRQIELLGPLKQDCIPLNSNQISEQTEYDTLFLILHDCISAINLHLSNIINENVASCLKDRNT